jgi:hypothetical protein
MHGAAPRLAAYGWTRLGDSDGEGVLEDRRLAGSQPVVVACILQAEVACVDEHFGRQHHLSRQDRHREARMGKQAPHSQRSDKL